LVRTLMAQPWAASPEDLPCKNHVNGSLRVEAPKAVMTRFWRVEKALEDSEGLRWIRERLGAYDWSKVDWVSVRRGRSEKYAFRGVCKVPRKGGGFRINCNVSKHAAYPIHQHMRVSPLYRNPDGTWPEVPEGYLVGDRFVAARNNGHSVQWKRLYRPLELGSEDEVLVFLVAHESFHYLRKTRQVEGRHGEIEADAFALKMLEQYRDEPRIARAPTPARRRD
jgi:hypothetical protein